MTTPDPRLRAADADRQAVVDRLSEHFTVGRLTASEYDERVRQAYASTYLDELPELLADLPDENHSSQSGFGEWGGPSTGRFDDGPSWSGRPGWGRDDRWYPPGEPWRGPRRGQRHRPPVAILPVLAVVALLIVLSHGFVLFPLLWVGVAVLIFRRHRHGGCRRGYGPRSTP